MHSSKEKKRSRKKEDKITEEKIIVEKNDNIRFEEKC